MMMNFDNCALQASGGDAVGIFFNGVRVSWKGGDGGADSRR